MGDTLDIPDQPTIAAKRGRRWLRFRLRTALLAVALVSVWLGPVCNRANRQRRAIARIKDVDGQVYYTHEYDGTRFLNDPPPGPAWLRNLIGIDYFGTVGHVDLDTGHVIDESATDDAAEALADLPDLRSVRLGGATNSMLAHLRGATELRHLTIDACSATVADATWETLKHFPHLEEFSLVGRANGDAAFSHIKSLANLKTLWVSGIGLTDAGMRNLEGLFGLEKLTLLDNSDITDSGWAPLGRLTRLTHLQLSGYNVTNATLKNIRGLTGLVDLELGKSNVSGPGLMHLKDLRQLESLVIESEEMTDGGLLDLGCPPRLKRLGLAGSHLTRFGVDQLHALMPKVQISCGRIFEPSIWP